jgi:putative copper export protein/methionine-rich copper-binding protein CopC
VLTPLLLAAVFLLGTAGPAAAHTELVGTDPVQGTKLHGVPLQVVMTFSEPVTLRGVTITTAGRELPVTSVPGKEAAVAVDLRGVTRSGKLVLDWRMIDAADGHETHGSLSWPVVAAAGTVDSTPTASPSASPVREAAAGGAPRDLGLVDGLARASRLLGYVALAILAGGLFFVSALWPAGAGVRRTRVVLGGAVGVGLLSSFASACLVLWRIDGRVSLDGALHGPLGEDYGRPVAVLVLLWLLASVVVVALLQGGATTARSLPWRVGALVVAGGMLRATGMSGHAAESSSGWASLADLLHLVAISAWFGGLVVVLSCLIPSTEIDEVRRVVRRFSVVAQVSVALIVGSGLILLWQVAGGPGVLLTTHYGRVLAVKLGLFGLVLTAALFSKRWLDRSVGSSNRRTGNVRPLTASVAAESALVLAVLGAASVLVTSSPGV